MAARETAERPLEGNGFRRLLKSEFAAGIFSFIPSEMVVDIAAYAGFHFMVFDTEHGTDDISVIERLVRAAAAVGIAPVVSFAQTPDPSFINRVLDTGVDALIFARISTRQEAEAVVRNSRIAPLGDRAPFLGSRAGHFFRISGDEYVRRANDVVIAVLIETKEGLDNAEEIVSVEGLDAVAVGPSDLADSLGVARDGPEVKAAIERVTGLARAKGKGVMAPAKDFAELESHLRHQDGPRVFWFASDTYHISNHFHELIEKSRELVAKHASATD
jgi:2-keto-3-deoxy-L-rhamnonate aldolase RhmA